MNKLISRLLNELWGQRIDKGSFLYSLGSITGSAVDEGFCLGQLEKGLRESDPETIDIFISVGFIVGFSEKSSFILCQLLTNPHHHKHEDIARLMAGIKDPSTVDCLYRAATLRFGYLDYDDTHQFARKCIKGLSAIGNENAVNKLRLLAGDEVPQIAAYAQKELRYKGVP